MNEYNLKYFERFCEWYRNKRKLEENERWFRYSLDANQAFERVLLKRFERHNEMCPFWK